MELARPAHDPAVKSTSAPSARGTETEPIPALDAEPGGLASHIAARLGHRRPSIAYALTALCGYLLLLGATVGLGELLTQVILQWGSVSRDDEQISRWLARERTPALDDASQVGSMIGDIPVLPGLVVLAVIVLLWAGRKVLAAAFVATAGLLELATYRVSSLIVHRDRPQVVRMDDLPVDQSYPSGHVAASIAVYGALALLISSWAKRRWVTVVVWSLAILLPAVVVLSRLYRGMHHVTDVAAGVLVGVAALLVAVLAARVCSAVIRRRTTTTEETS
jgi:undecaprenyl-diphosphatase